MYLLQLCPGQNHNINIAIADVPQERWQRVTMQEHPNDRMKCLYATFLSVIYLHAFSYQHIRAVFLTHCPANLSGKTKLICDCKSPHVSYIVNFLTDRCLVILDNHSVSATLR